MTLLRGKANIVQVFDQTTGEVNKSFDLGSQIEEPIRGLHTLSEHEAISKHVIVDEKGQSYLLNHQSGSLDTLFKLKGQHITHTYMVRSSCLTQGSLKTSTPKEANLLACLSKDTPIQIWDVDNQAKGTAAPLWSARNVPNDELDLAVPIYDTSMAVCHGADPFGRVLAVSTAYGEIREYDVRASRRATANNQIVKTA